MRTVRAATGLEGKRVVNLEAVTGEAGELAGVSLARFGGFFVERLRAHDFLSATARC